MNRPVVVAGLGLMAVAAVSLTPTKSVRESRQLRAASGGCPQAAVVAANAARSLVAGRPSPLYDPDLAAAVRRSGLAPLAVTALDVNNSAVGASTVEVIVDALTPGGVTVAVPLSLVVSCSPGRVTIDGASRP
jgi:hypothetical protein